MDMRAQIFAIAQAAELAEMHPQTLRQYDRIGLVSPHRTAGNTRRYSLHDIEKLRRVAQLSAEGLNLEGIRRVLMLEETVTELEDRVRQVERALSTEILNRPERRMFAAGSAGGEVISVRRGARLRRNTEIMVWRPNQPDTG